MTGGHIVSSSIGAVLASEEIDNKVTSNKVTLVLERHCFSSQSLISNIKIQCINLQTQITNLYSQCRVVLFFGALDTFVK